MPKTYGDSALIEGSAFGLSLIEHLAQQARPMGLTDIVVEMKVSKSRVFRHLQTLVNKGFLTQDDETGRYQIGPRSLALGLALESGLDLLEIAMPILRGLRDRLGHSAVLSQIEAHGVRVVVTITSRSMFEIGVRRGSLLVAHATAQGKVALAFGNGDFRDRLRGRLERMTPFTIVDPKLLKKELMLIERRGWATAYNEALLGMNALAAPVLNTRGDLVATIGIVDSIQHLEATPSDEQIKETMEAARCLSQQFGFNGRLPRSA